ncbi:MAG: YicC family protein [Lysobacterales bacterium]|nr:MAG: YicC family protein [Xanthomonadales bacterium]
MIRSMTGFARRERQGPYGTLSCELRSVNHRYLELSLRLPDDLRGLENDARQVISGLLRRGKVDAGLYLRGAPAAAASIEINTALLDQVLARAADVRARAGAGAAPVDPLDVLRWPGVIREAERDVTPLATAAMDLLRETAEELNESRGREGRRIRDMLVQRCETLRELVSIVRARLPEVSARIRGRIAERVAQLGVQVDPERLEQEIALLAHKMDVEEELDRLGSHVTETLQVLDSTEPAGRRLDFLMQEFNREANTLSSKSQDAETTRAAVDMKVLIEQMREQVQNVE